MLDITYSIDSLVMFTVRWIILNSIWACCVKYNKWVWETGSPSRLYLIHSWLRQGLFIVGDY